MIDFGVDLRHVGFGMSEEELGGLDAELPQDRGPCVVSQAVRPASGMPASGAAAWIKAELGFRGKA